MEYTQAGLSDLLRRRSGIDFGDVLELRPLKRGASGRIIELLIQGTLRTVIVGKELEIRRWLSESHLYSSAFVVDTVYEQHLTASSPITSGAPASHDCTETKAAQKVTRQKNVKIALAFTSGYKPTHYK